MQRLGPLVEPGVAALAFEKAAGVLLGEEPHDAGGRIGRKKMRVELFDRKERLHEAAVGQDPAVGEAGEEAPTVEVVGDWLGIEGVMLAYLVFSGSRVSMAVRRSEGLTSQSSCVWVLIRSSTRTFL
jgi:hypothetical protein